MASDRPRLEDGSTDDYESELNRSPTDELAAVSALARSAGELMIIQTLQRFIGPVLVPILKPLIREIVTEQVGLAKLELLASMKKNPANEATTSVPKRLKLQFRNRISPPVYTGKPLSGENGATIEIALVDAVTEQIMNTGIESTAKLEIVGFRVGDEGSVVDDSLTFEDFQERVMSEKKGKRILQGDTCLQLKEGVCFVRKISFTHNSENTKNGLYRLGAGVVDAASMNRVEVATTEAFLMKDGRTKYHEKHPHPRLSAKVCHLHHISYKGTRYRNLKDEGVFTVKDLLTLLYTDPKQLQDILKLGASSNTWGDIVKNAQASSGMFLCLDPGNEGKTGVILNAKKQLQGLLVEPHHYIPVDSLSSKQKMDNEELVKFASEHFKMLESFEDEASFQEYLKSCTSFSQSPSANQNLGTSNMIDSNGLTETPNNLNKSNSGQHTAKAPILTSPYERGKEKLPFDDDSTTSFEVVESTLNTCGHMDTYNVFDQCIDCFLNNQDSIVYFDREWHSEPVNSDSDVIMVATQTVSVCARTRWTKVSRLLRRNSVRERISLIEGIPALKKQRCC